MNKLEKIGFVALSLLLPAVVAAQGIVPAPISGLPGSTSSSLTGNLRIYINLALGITGLIAIGFLIIGGFQYITSGGNEELAERGKKTIQNSIIGLVVIILSYIIVTVIYNAILTGTP